MPVNAMNINILNFGFVFFSSLEKVGVFSFISKWVSDNSHWIGSSYPSPINGILKNEPLSENGRKYYSSIFFI